MVEGPGLRGWGPRLLAPIAFFAAATVLIILVHSALSGGDSSTATTGPAVTQVATTGAGETSPTTTGKGRGKKKRFYVVRSGDTFESIAVRFETSVAELEVLNPDVDAASLTVGERIRLR